MVLYSREAAAIITAAADLYASEVITEVLPAAGPSEVVVVHQIIIAQPEATPVKGVEMTAIREAVQEAEVMTVAITNLRA